MKSLDKWSILKKTTQKKMGDAINFLGEQKPEDVAIEESIEVEGPSMTILL